MKRIQRINRVSRKRPPRQSKLLPIAIITVAVALSVQTALMGAFFTAAGASAIGYYHNVTTQGLVRLRHAPTRVNVRPTTILDRHGRVLWKISDSSRGLHRYVPLAQIPLYMKEAIIATEDKTFYTNPGFEPNALVRALLIDLQYHGAVAAAQRLHQERHPEPVPQHGLLRPPGLRRGGRRQGVLWQRRLEARFSPVRLRGRAGAGAECV